MTLVRNLIAVWAKDGVEWLLPHRVGRVLRNIDPYGRETIVVIDVDGRQVGRVLDLTELEPWSCIPNTTGASGFTVRYDPDDRVLLISNATIVGWRVGPDVLPICLGSDPYSPMVIDRGPGCADDRYLRPMHSSARSFLATVRDLGKLAKAKELALEAIDVEITDDELRAVLTDPRAVAELQAAQAGEARP
jgi:hypothetical protein